MKNVQSAHDAFLDRELDASDRAEAASEMYDQDFDPEAREEQLEQDAAGREIVFGEPRRLLLDIDSVAQREQFDALLPYLKRFWRVDDISEWKSKSGNQHISIRFHDDVAEMDMFKRIALQAILGSDPVKEILSVLRGQNMPDVEPTCLFKPKKGEVK